MFRRKYTFSNRRRFTDKFKRRGYRRTKQSRIFGRSSTRGFDIFRNRDVQVIVGAALLFVAVIFLSNRWTPVIELEGSQSESVEWKGEWNDPGAKAQVRGSTLKFIKFPISVKQEGEVKPAILGTYKIKYTAEYRGKTTEVIRNVVVRDTVPPEITLIHDENFFVQSGEIYEEEGFKAVDNHDGDITDSVTREEEGTKIVYTAVDSSGNTTVVKRDIPYDDRVPPLISFDDGETITIAQGKKFNNVYAAYDEVDGDLTNKVKIEGEVDTKKVGEYKLKYSVSDSHGNYAERVKTVVVEVAYQGDGQIIYLTFDDGPTAYTEEILDALGAYGVQATFFVNGTQPDYYYNIGRAYSDGHSIGVRTYSNDYAQIYSGEDPFWDDFVLMEDVIWEQTGITTPLMRFPGGSTNTISDNYYPGLMNTLRSQASQMGYIYFDWNVDSGDGEGLGAEDIYWNIVNGVENKEYSVVLCHDSNENTAEAISMVIEWAIDNGFAFEALTAYSPTAHH